jgi:hypothetical protein
MGYAECTGKKPGTAQTLLLHAGIIRGRMRA